MRFEHLVLEGETAPPSQQLDRRYDVMSLTVAHPETHPSSALTISQKQL